MRPRRRRAELLGGEVVDAHQLHSASASSCAASGAMYAKSRWKPGDVIQPWSELRVRKRTRGAPFHWCRFELGGVDRLHVVGDVDDARRSDEPIDRHVIDRRAIADEMHRRVDVSAAVRAERIGRRA